MQNILLHILAAAVGFIVIAGTGLSAVRTMVLPRAARSVLTGAVFAWVRRVFSLLARGDFERQDRVLALYTPVALLSLAAAWMISFTLGFAALFWAVGDRAVTDSLWSAGSSLVTLGSATLVSSVDKILGVSAAAVGLGVVALLIAFLPSLYAAFSEREAMVALLETEAGSPASPIEMLIRLHRIGMLDRLTGNWERWQRWFVEIDESHTSYPSLVWLRSPVSTRSWVTAASTVLDAAALWLAAVDAPYDPRAALCIRSGYVSLRRIGGFFRIEFDADPAPDDVISITREQFDEAVAELVEGGIAVNADRDQAWRDFSGWRVNYDAVVAGLVAVTRPYPTRWTTVP